MAVMQVQIQALLAAAGGAGGERGAVGSNTGSHMEVAKLAIFNGEVGRVGGFITACRLYIKMRLREKYGGGTSTMGFDICAGRVSGCVEREYNRGTGIRGSRV